MKEIPNKTPENMTKKIYEGLVSVNGYIAKSSNALGTNVLIDNVHSNDITFFPILVVNKLLPVDSIYFRTASGNIYKIGQSEQAGKIEIVNAKDNKTYFSPKPPVKDRSWGISVGDEFYWRDTDESLYHSSRVTEFVAVSRVKRLKIIGRNIISKQKNSIISDFQELRSRAVLK